jgi:protein O-mannosyl-transferase
MNRQKKSYKNSYKNSNSRNKTNLTTHTLSKSPLDKKQITKTPVYLGLAIIVVCGIIIYSNSFSCSFHFDDLLRIFSNDKIKDLSKIKTWWNSYPSRPIGVFTFVLNYHFFKFDIWYWHLVNLVIHLVNSLLVWWLCLLVFSSPAIKDSSFSKDKHLVAFFTALLFVSHPLATQSVTYIVQRLSSLVAMFYLLSLILYVKGRIYEKGFSVKILLFAGSLAAGVLAMLTKENAFTLPFAIVLFELFFLRTKQPSINFKDYRVFLLIVAFLMILIIIPLRFSFNVFKPIAASSMNTVTIAPLNYLLTQFTVILKYIQLLFVPVNQNLDYDFPISNTLFSVVTFLSFLGLLSLIILAVLSFKKYRIISFGIVWFLICLSIESGFIPIRDVIFEHRTYLPSVGFFLIITTGIYSVMLKNYKPVAISLLILIVMINSYLTYERNKIWKNDLTLWTDIVSKSPNKARALYNLAMVYDYLKQYDESINYYSRAIIAYPGDIDAYINRGVAYGNQDRWNDAINDYTSAIKIDPGFKNAYKNRGIAFGKISGFQNEISDETKALELDSKDASAYYNRGTAYGNLGQWQKSIADQSQAIKLDPRYTDAYTYRAIAFANLKQPNKAIDDFSKVIQLDPSNANAFYNRGNVWYYSRNWKKAISDYTSSIELDSKVANTYFNRGVAYEAVDSLESAIADFNNVLKIDPEYKSAMMNRENDYKKLRLSRR